MSDCRGIKERLAAGAAAERELAEFKERLYFALNMLGDAEAGAKEYRRMQTAVLDNRLTKDGSRWCVDDPLGDCQAIDYILATLRILKVSNLDPPGHQVKKETQ